MGEVGTTVLEGISDLNGHIQTVEVIAQQLQKEIDKDVVWDSECDDVITIVSQNNYSALQTLISGLYIQFP